MDFLIILFIFSNFFSSLHYSNEIPLEAYKAAELQDDEEYSKAVELYENALEKSPDHYLIMYNLGTAYYANGEPDKAAAIFDSLLINDSVPEDLIPDITYNAGTSYLRWVQIDTSLSTERLDISIDLLIESLKSIPSDRDSRRNLEIALRLKNQSQSETDTDEQQDDNQNEDQQDEQQDDNQNEDQQDEQQDDNQNEDQQDEQQDDNQNEDQQDEQQDDNQNEDQQDEQQDDNQNEDQQDDNQNEDQQDEQQDDSQNEDQQDLPYNMTQEQAERLLDAALNAPGEDTLSPMKVKGFPSGSW